MDGFGAGIERGRGGRADTAAIAADGPLKLVVTRETRPARWVRNLVAVLVLTAQ